jgi:hypothetical protein
MLQPIDKKKQKNHMQDSYEELQAVEGISNSTSAVVELAAIKLLITLQLYTESLVFCISYSAFW